MFDNTINFGIKISTVTRLSWIRSAHKVPPRNLYALVYRKLGTASFKFDDGTELITNKGEIFYCPAFLGYNVFYDDGEIIVFHFYAEGLPNKPVIKKLPDSNRAGVIFESALKIWEEHKSGYYYKVLSLFFEILSICSAENNIKIKHRLEYHQACEYLKNNVLDPEITISEICSRYFVSETGFRKFFDDVYGVPPVKYITEMRIREAERLLISSDHTIENIAYSCGFNDVKYFSRVFSSYRGCSPSRFRKYSSL